MEMKNKLFRHHKSKFYFLARSFSFIFLGIIATVGAVTIPTYFSVAGEARYAIQASEVEPTDNEEENLFNIEDGVEENNQNDMNDNV